MGLLDGLKGLLGRGASSQPEDLILPSLGNLSSTLVTHLSTDCYRWTEPKEVKMFECLILARFLLDYALERTYRGKLPPTELHRYQAVVEARFRWLMENTFQNRFTYDVVQDTITNRLALYREVMVYNSHPICWQILASVATGIDYPAEKDPSTLVASSLTLDKLFAVAQDALKRTVGQ